jgi:hypothetical protein
MVRKAEGRRQKAEMLRYAEMWGEAQHFCFLPSAFCFIVTKEQPMESI